MTERSLGDWVSQYRPQLIALGFWLVIALIANTYMRLNDLTVLELAEELSHLLKDNWYGPLLYILAYFLRPLTFFPGTPFTMLAGFVYGLWWGFLYAMIAGLVSVTIPYSLGRWFSDADHLEKRLQQSDSRIFKLLDGLRDNPFQTTLTTRFLYLPYDLVNFVAGNLHIRLLPFILATTLGNLINVLIMVDIGAAMADFADSEFTINPLLLVLLVVIWLLSFIITRYFKRKNEEILRG